MKGGVICFGQTPIFGVETKALRGVFSSVSQVGFNKIVIEGDSQMVIKALKGNIEIRWQVFNFIEGILP